MSSGSHEALIDAPQRPASEGALLAEAFSDFIAASSRLELSYRDLQQEVAELSLALSERNRALSESLSENKVMGERLQRILETLPCGVLVVSEDGSVRLANPEAARLLALSNHQTFSSEAIAVAVPGLRLELRSPFTAGDEDEQELALERGEGRVWIAVRRVRLPTTLSSLAGKSEAVLTLRDISARKRMEEEREAARDAVALAQVSAVLAHEIRNPLASLELFAGLLGDEPGHRDEWLSHLRAGIRSLSGTVNNVLTIHGNTSLFLEPVDVLTEAALAVDFLQPMARQAEVSLGFCASEAPVSQASGRSRANRSALHQILMNLCANALRHTPAGGAVRVTCHHGTPGTDHALRLSVTDTGCGIPAEHLPHLFEVGFSGSGVTSGLGLAVCHRLVRQMDGRLTVESRVGHGSTFTVELHQP